MDHYLIMSSHNELYHHGIQGMKWGVRRFQNKDGSLTSAGKKRYDDNGKMKQLDTDTTVTRKVKNDYNNMNDGDFRRKYGTSKSTYAKRVEKSKTGDPFADNPVTKNAIRITTNAINKENKKFKL